MACEHHNEHPEVPNGSDSAMTYTCPMHPEIRQGKPGMCPECGMTLVKIKNKKPAQSGHSKNVFLRKFWVSLILTIPVVLYADIFEKIFKLSMPPFFGSEYLPFVFGSIVFFYGGKIFLLGAWREIQGRLPGMMSLIAIAITAAYAWSVYATFRGEETLFWELTTLITIMLLGHHLEMRAVKGAQSALKELSKLLPDTAEIIRGGRTDIIPLSELKEGDIVIVRPGAKIPADGNVSHGDSDVNESMVTGESKPVSKKTGDEVIAGTINGDGALKISVSRIGEKTFLAGVMRLVAEAESSKSRLQVLSDKAAFYLTVIAVIGGAATLISWLLAGSEAGFAVARLVAVLVIACPHALGLAVPLVASISTTKAAQSGFLVRQRIALESARNVDIVLFDKTGTLTKGEFGVTRVWAASGSGSDEVLRLAASVDSHSEHPIAKAVVKEAHRLKLPIQEPEKFEAIRGKGAKAILAGREVIVGGPSVIESLEKFIPREMEYEVKEAGAEGKTVIFVIKDGELLGAIALADILREESREAVDALGLLGMRTAMITGDSAEVAEWVGRELGIDERYSRVLPHEKSQKVKDLQKLGLKVAMVGDGVNDAPALSQADVGIAIGAGTNVAIESAGIILVRNDPRDIAKIMKLSRATYKKMVENLWWAAGYNIVAMPLAAGALYFKGILLEPAFSAVLMSASTVIVAANALLLKRSSV